MNYIIIIIFIALSFYIINKTLIYRTKSIPKLWINIAFSIKLLAAMAMIIIYSRSEKIKSDADIFRYYEDSEVIFSALQNGEPIAYLKLITGVNSDDSSLDKYYIQINNFEHQEENNLTSNRLFIRYIAFLSIFTLGTYGGIVVITSFLAFTGLWWIFLFFYSKLKKLKWVIFGIVFFTPSIVYWTSGILKESLLILAISLIFNCGNYALQGKHPIKRIFILILAFTVIFNIKPFLLLILIPPVLAYLWLHFRPTQRALIPYFMMFFIAFSFVSESGKYMDIGIYDLLLEKQLQFTELALSEDSGSLVSPIMFQANSLSIATNSPIAIINTLFRPMFWEANNIMALFASFENLAIIILILLIIIFPRNNVDDPSLVWFTFIFSISFFIIIGLATPVLGALSRYRVIGLLFFLLGLIQLLDIEKIKNIISIKLITKK
ncbi:MAG: hypothetical protein DRI86_10380 [Bacteroidetes bacterium]|nr:MAG: hypothetical protein DRI86_10380 [Bacteroidota bacterium]